MMLIGFCFSWLGDVLLISESSKCFLAGLVSFLLAHIAYAVAFLIRGLNPTWIAATAAVVIIASVLIGRWLIPHVKRTAPEMELAVLAYMAVISLMVILAAGASSGNFLILGGAVAFFVSDVSVARDKFVAPGFTNKAWGLPLYYVAQFLLASTVSI